MNALPWHSLLAVLSVLVLVLAVWCAGWVMGCTWQAKLVRALRACVKAEREVNRASEPLIAALRESHDLHTRQLAALQEQYEIAWSLLEQLGENVPGVEAFLRKHHEETQRDVARLIEETKGGE